MVVMKTACLREWNNPHNSASTELGSGKATVPEVAQALDRAVRDQHAVELGVRALDDPVDALLGEVPRQAVAGGPPQTSLPQPPRSLRRGGGGPQVTDISKGGSRVACCELVPH
eukprot:8174143-Pyramimonas_sp.AAC.1